MLDGLRFWRGRSPSGPARPAADPHGWVRAAAAKALQQIAPPA
jgi:hypothetical protein